MQADVLLRRLKQFSNLQLRQPDGPLRNSKFKPGLFPCDVAAAFGVFSSVDRLSSTLSAGGMVPPLFGSFSGTGRPRLTASAAGGADFAVRWLTCVCRCQRFAEGLTAKKQANIIFYGPGRADG